MVLIFPLISNCSNSLSNSLETIASTSTTIAIKISRMFHSFLRSFLKYTFHIFSFISTCLMVSASNIPKYLFSFSPSVQMHYCSIPSVDSLFLLFIMSMAYFSMPNFIPMCCWCILIVCIKISNPFFIFRKYIYFSHINVFNFSSDVVNLQPPEHFLRSWLSDNIAITNSSGENGSSWKMPHCFFYLGLPLSNLPASFPWYSCWSL